MHRSLTQIPHRQKHTQGQHQHQSAQRPNHAGLVETGGAYGVAEDEGRGARPRDIAGIDDAGVYGEGEARRARDRDWLAPVHGEVLGLAGDIGAPGGDADALHHQGGAVERIGRGTGV